MRVSFIDAGRASSSCDGGVDDLADEQRVRAEVELVAHLAVHPGDGLLEHGRARGRRRARRGR